MIWRTPNDNYARGQQVASLCLGGDPSAGHDAFIPQFQYFPTFTYFTSERSLTKTFWTVVFVKTF